MPRASAWLQKGSKMKDLQNTSLPITPRGLFPTCVPGGPWDLA